MNFFDESGNIKNWVADLLAALGAILVFFPMWLEWHPYIVIAGFLVGLSLVGFSAFALRSKTFDLRAFTNDPLGWRKAKKSYESSEAEAEAAPEDQPPKP